MFPLSLLSTTVLEIQVLSEVSFYVQGSRITQTCSPVKQNRDLETGEEGGKSKCTRYFQGAELLVVRGSSGIEDGIREGTLFNESAVNSPCSSEEDIGSVPSTHTMANSHA